MQNPHPDPWHPWLWHLRGGGGNDQSSDPKSGQQDTPVPLGEKKILGSWSLIEVWRLGGVTKLRAQGLSHPRAGGGQGGGLADLTAISSAG